MLEFTGRIDTDGWIDQVMACATDNEQDWVDGGMLTSAALGKMDSEYPQGFEAKWLNSRSTAKR